MTDAVALVNFAPLARLLLLGGLIAIVPLAWVWLRQRGGNRRARLAALTALTVFLTFDLIVFGAFTRLSDSGLGCPDWPGCYGHVSPVGAAEQIQAAQAAQPNGPVTMAKAWIEMIHRYLAMMVGALILVLAAATWWERWRPSASQAVLPTAVHAAGAAPPLLSPWWPTLTLVWVLVQGLFGKYTVTLKLYPAIVTLHLLGGLLLLAMLALQREAYLLRPAQVPARLRRVTWLALGVLVLQLALGGWVSTNYAVVACTGFPTCSGQWWPAMDATAGFQLLRPLGRQADGAGLPLQALVAIHMAHRLVAVLVAVVLGWLAWRLWRLPVHHGLRGMAGLLAALVAAQWATGLINVIFDWPMAAALLHTAGAAALVWVLTVLLARGAAVPASARAPVPGASA